MEIKINLTEVASELAHADLLNRYGYNLEEVLYNGENYTENAQEEFDSRYDYYFDIISNMRIYE